jgi:hypothetical protein
MVGLDVDEFVRGVNLSKAVPTGLDMSNCLALLRTLREDHNSLSTTVISLVDKVDLMLAKLGAEAQGEAKSKGEAYAV